MTKILIEKETVEQEPVAKVYDPYDCNGLQWFCSDPPNTGTKLYTAPPPVPEAHKRTWVGLTDDDLKPVCDEYRILFGGWVHDFARAIEAKLKEKNT